MKRGNLIHNIFCAVILSWICVLGLTACGGDSGPTPGSLAITTTALPEGEINQPYSALISGSGGALPYTWSVSPALPANLSFITQSGAITGTPGTAGTSSHIFTLVDSSIPPQTIEKSLSLTIKPPLSITTTSLPAGNIGAVYNQPVQTVGGTGPLTFSIVPPGTLPRVSVWIRSLARSQERRLQPATLHSLSVLQTLVDNRTHKVSRFALTRPARHRLRPPRCQLARSVSPTISRCRQPLGLAHLPGLSLWDRSHRVSRSVPLQLDPV